MDHTEQEEPITERDMMGEGRRRWGGGGGLFNDVNVLTMQAISHCGGIPPRNDVDINSYDTLPIGLRMMQTFL